MVKKKNYSEGFDNQALLDDVDEFFDNKELYEGFLQLTEEQKEFFNENKEQVINGVKDFTKKIMNSAMILDCPEANKWKEGKATVSDKIILLTYVQNNIKLDAESVNNMGESMASMMLLVIKRMVIDNFGKPQYDLQNEFINTLKNSKDSMFNEDLVMYMAINVTEIKKE